MLESVRLKNFRGFKDTELCPLSQITLISGKNNAGKSSVLEGIFLLLAHALDDPFSKLDHFRGMPKPSPKNQSYMIWGNLFHKMDTSKKMQIIAGIDGDKAVLTYARDNGYRPPSDVILRPESDVKAASSVKTGYALKTSYSLAGHKTSFHYILSEEKLIMDRSRKTILPTDKAPMSHFINSFIANTDSTSIAEWFSAQELAGKKDKIIEIMRLIAPDTSDISTIAQNGAYQLYVKIGGDRMPLKLAGDGMNRLLYIVLSILAHPRSVILIDEIETGFHYSMYSKLWEVAAAAAKENDCQVIATTHSYECIMGAADGMEAADMTERFSYYRLDKENEKIFVTRYPYELVAAACDANVEVR